MLIPCGKHKGKALSALPDSSLLGMYGSWQGIPSLRDHEFLSRIFEEIRSRGLEDRAAKSGKPAAAPGLRSRQVKPKKGKNRHRSFDAANCGCGNGVKLAVFVVENGEQFCDIECTACKKSFGRMGYDQAKGAMRKGWIFFIEPAKQSKEDQRRVDYREDNAENSEITREYLELMGQML